MEIVFLDTDKISASCSCVMFLLFRISFKFSPNPIIHLFFNVYFYYTNKYGIILPTYHCFSATQSVIHLFCCLQFFHKSKCHENPQYHLIRKLQIFLSQQISIHLLSIFFYYRMILFVLSFPIIFILLCYFTNNPTWIPCSNYV